MGGDCVLWAKNKQFSSKLPVNKTAPPVKSPDQEIQRSLYFLGKALYRYSLLQKQKEEK